ncbi:hypothetical protein SLA2020_308060 [Shorea laevis]
MLLCISPTHSPSFFNIIYLINLLFFIYTHRYAKVIVRIDNDEIPPDSGSFSKQISYQHLHLHGVGATSPQPPARNARGTAGRVSSTIDPILPLPFVHE